MKLSPLNNINFKGLWGNNRQNTKYYSNCTVIENDKEYFPFADEDKEEISEIINKNSKIEIYDIDGKTGLPKKVITDRVLVKEKLPYTYYDWQAFKKVSAYNKSLGIFEPREDHCTYKFKTVVKTDTPSQIDYEYLMNIFNELN